VEESGAKRGKVKSGHSVYRWRVNRELRGCKLLPSELTTICNIMQTTVRYESTFMLFLLLCNGTGY